MRGTRHELAHGLTLDKSFPRAFADPRITGEIILAHYALDATNWRSAWLTRLASREWHEKLYREAAQRKSRKAFVVDCACRLGIGKQVFRTKCDRQNGRTSISGKLPSQQTKALWMRRPRGA